MSRDRSRDRVLVYALPSTQGAGEYLKEKAMSQACLPIQSQRGEFETVTSGQD